MEYLKTLIEQKKDLRVILVVDSKDNYLLDDFHFETAMRLLPLHTQSKILGKRPEIRKVSLCNQLLQLFGCAFLTGKRPSEIEFVVGAHGKPRIKDGSVAYSMSNSDGITVMYLKRSEPTTSVGVDLATTKDCEQWETDYLHMFKDIFSAQEYLYLQDLPCGPIRDSTFTHYWSLKEAYTKYTGTGLNCDLSSVDFKNVEPLERSKSQRVLTHNNSETHLFLSSWLDDKQILTICDGPSDSNNQNLIDVPTVNLHIKIIVQYLSSIK